MEKIYILIQKVKRAETTDTSIIIASDDRGLVEEYLLSVYEYAKELHDDVEFLKQFADTFEIIEVPFMNDKN